MTKITYDSSLDLTLLGITPFYRLGPEQWFDTVSIISYLQWDAVSPKNLNVHSLLDINPNLTLPQENTQSIVKSDEFKTIVDQNKLINSKFISYKPVEIPFLSDGMIQEDDRHFTTTFENKAWLRNEYSSKLRFPDYLVDGLDTLQDFHSYCEQLNTRSLVVQHEQLSGGRGTFFASDSSEFSSTIDRLKHNTKVGATDRIVISRALAEPKEVSFQACITRYGVFIGPPQQQFVRHPLLVNVSSPTADQFCGGVISEDLIDEATRLQAHSAISTIADELSVSGYKGIFGVDFLLDENEELYVLEVNARMTGMLPLLTQLQKEYPFLLLHILEKTNQEYSLGDDSLDTFNPERINPGAFVVVHDTAGKEHVAIQPLVSGSYDGASKELVSDTLYIQENTTLLHNYMVPGQVITKDRRLGAIFSGNDIRLKLPLAGIDEKFIGHYKNSFNTSK